MYDWINYPNTLSFSIFTGKCIHSSAMGYPGGIAWTIMVARTCQMYPHAAVGSLVEHVFSTFATWPWPKAVILRELVRSDLGMEQYDASVRDFFLICKFPVIYVYML